MNYVEYFFLHAVHLCCVEFRLKYRNRTAVCYHLLINQLNSFFPSHIFCLAQIYLTVMVYYYIILIIYLFESFCLLFNELTCISYISVSKITKPRFSVSWQLGALQEVLEKLQAKRLPSWEKKFGQVPTVLHL